MMNRFSLVELVVVLLVLAGLAAVVVPLVGSAPDDARERSTGVTMLTVREAIMGSGSQPGYWQDVGGYPRPSDQETPPEGTRVDHPQLHYLFEPPAGEPGFDPATGIGWRGPYLQASTGTYEVTGDFSTDYGEDDDAAILDGWQQPLILQLWSGGAALAARQQYARLISFGPNGALDTDAADQDAGDIAADSDNDDRVLFLQVPGAVNLDSDLDLGGN